MQKHNELTSKVAFDGSLEDEILIKEIVDTFNALSRVMVEINNLKLDYKTTPKDFW